MPRIIQEPIAVAFPAIPTATRRNQGFAATNGAAKGFPLAAPWIIHPTHKYPLPIGILRWHLPLLQYGRICGVG